MPVSPRDLWNAKVLYPVAGLVMLGALVGISRCPLTYANASDFSLPVVSPSGTPGPDRMRLADQRGRVVLLDFWATWCGPCARATPVLQRISRRFRDRGLVVIGIDMDEGGPDGVPAFMRTFGADYPIVYDDTGVARQYNVRALPTVVLIDRQGRIRHMHQGLATESELAEEVEGLL